MMFVCVHVKCAKMVPFHKSGHNGILQYIGIAQKLFQIEFIVTESHKEYKQTQPFPQFVRLPICTCQLFTSSM